MLFESCTTLTSPILAASAWSEGVGKLRDTGYDVLYATPSALIGLIIVAAFWLVGWGVRRTVHRVTMKRQRRNLALVLGRLIQGFMIVVGVLVGAVVVFPNFTPASLVTSLGLGSLALGIAFKDVLENYLAGILLLWTEPFRIGDQITFKDFEGTVEDIQTRATTIRTYDGRRVVVPNAEIFTNAVTVNTAFEKRRLEYDVGIGYGDDINRAKQVMLDAMGRLDIVLKDPPPEALTYELAESSVNVRIRWWIEPPRKKDYFEGRDAVLTAVRYALAEAGIDLPYPTRQVLLHDQTEETDGDRTRQREGWPAPSDGDAPEPRNIARAIASSSPSHDGDGTRRGERAREPQPTTSRDDHA